MSDLKFEAAGVLGTGLVSALFATTRVRRVGAEHYLRLRERGEPLMFVVWHGQLLPLVHCHRREGIVVLVSEHADGEYITRIMENYGYETVRGSSTRGATKALKGLIRAARAGKDLAITPDGPQGPAHVMKAGALAVAQATGLPMVPIAMGASSGWRFRSWDGFLIPRPLSRITVEYAPPVRVPRDATRAELEAVGQEMENTLNALTRKLNPDMPPPAGGGGATPAGDASAGGEPAGDGMAEADGA